MVVHFDRLEGGQGEACEDSSSGEDSCQDSSDSAGEWDPDFARPLGGGPSCRALWRSTTSLRGVWLHNQLENMSQALRHFNVDDPIEAPSWVADGMSLSFKDVSFSVKVPDQEKPKVILENCCGHFPAGSFVAMMGPSGCGKTTLLDILARKKTLAHTGQVYLNGRATDHLFPRIASYVDSSDTNPPHWTVREAISFSFYLKGAVPVYKHFRRERVNELVDFYMESLGLGDVARSKIGGETVRGISSGQRRRVTLAKGMVTNVPLLFCDEPTSGLSSTDAEACMKSLRIQTRRWHKTVVVVIHQPRVEVARLFDRLVLLTARPGRLVYDGPMKDAEKYWALMGHAVPEEANPTDHFMDTISPDIQPELADEFARQYRVRLEPEIMKEVAQSLEKEGPSALEHLKQSHTLLQVFGKMPRVRNSKYSVGLAKQVRLLAVRKVTLMMRDPAIILMQLIVPLFEGAGLGFCFMGIANKTPKGFMVISGWLNMLLMGVLFGGFTGVPQLIDERILMQKEASEALYSEHAHICVGMILDMCVTLVRNAIFITVMYLFAELPLTWEHFGPFFCWILAVGVVMDPIFKAAAAFAKDMQTATMAGLMFVLFIAVFNGIGFVTKRSAPAVLLPLLDIMPSSLVATQVAWGLYGDEEAVWKQLDSFIGLEEASPWYCGAVLLGWFVLFNVAAALGLTFIKHVEK